MTRPDRLHQGVLNGLAAGDPDLWGQLVEAATSRLIHLSPYATPPDELERYCAIVDARGAMEEAGAVRTHVKVYLFKDGGKYYTSELWEIPEGAIGPYDMSQSPDFRRIGGGAVLVPTQEPWGFPHLFPGQHSHAGADCAEGEILDREELPC